MSDPKNQRPVPKANRFVETEAFWQGTKAGELIYKERLPDASSVAASLWIAGDQLFALDEKGKTFVIATGPDFKVTRTNQIEGLFWSTPSIAGDSLLLRSADKIHCIRASSKALTNL